MVPFVSKQPILPRVIPKAEALFHCRLSLGRPIPIPVNSLTRCRSGILAIIADPVFYAIYPRGIVTQPHSPADDNPKAITQLQRSAWFLSSPSRSLPRVIPESFDSPFPPQSFTETPYPYLSELV